jgi:hypothetical protein
MSESLSKQLKSAKLFAPDQGWQFAGLRLPLWPGLTVFISRQYFWLIFFAGMVYLIAGEINGEWLYLLAACLVSAALVELIWPFIQILDASLAVSMPTKAVAMEKFKVTLHLHHALFLGFLGQILPLRCLRIRLKFSDQDGDLVLLLKAFVAERIGDKTALVIDSELLNRGVYQYAGAEVASSFPFNLVWWVTQAGKQMLSSAAEARSGQLTVYPQVIPMRGPLLEAIFAKNQIVARFSKEQRSMAASASVRGLRDYRRGDSPRWVHWRAYARTGRLVVKEFDAESNLKYMITIDPRADWQSADQFELAVVLVNSIIHSDPELLKFELLVPSFAKVPEIERELTLINADLNRSREVLARVRPVTVNENTTQTNRSADDFTSLESEFHDTLKRHPAGIIFAVVPAEGEQGVNLIEAQIDKHGYVVNEAGRQSRFGRGAGSLLPAQEISRRTGRGHLIATVTKLDEIAGL